MFHFSDNELINLLDQDAPYLDNTSFGLGIKGGASVNFYPKKDEITLCGLDECVRLARICGIESEIFAKDGAKIQPKEAFLRLNGEAMSLLRVVKTMQNVLEHASSVATYTRAMLENARSQAPHIALLGTRKTMPYAKKLLLKALICGGGLPHRYGLSDSVLVFSEHRLLCKDFEQGFSRLKNAYKEHKIIVEVENANEAHYFAALGADILQCERFSCEALSELVAEIKAKFPHILLSATGGVHRENAAAFAKTGVDMLVSTAMYRAEICDIKVKFARV